LSNAEDQRHLIDAHVETTRDVLNILTFTSGLDDSTLEVVRIDLNNTVTYVVDGEVIVVDSNLVYLDSNGDHVNEIDGTVVVTKGRKTYEFIFEDVTLDTACGIPDGGTITVNGIPMDFSATTCENPTVIVTIRGRQVELSLDDALNLVLG